MAGMAALVEVPALRLLRPLLAIAPGRLRATLRARGADWSEDPSNQDPAALRARLRTLQADPAGDGPGVLAACRLAAASGAARAAAEAEIAEELVKRAEIHGEGYAVISPGPIGAPTLAALLRSIAGRPYPLSGNQVARLAASLSPATVGGARIIPGGRLGGQGGCCCARPRRWRHRCRREPGAVWDRRFRLGGAKLPDGATFGALGDDAARLRRRSDLPAAVLRTLPALRVSSDLLGVPHLGYWANRGADAIIWPEPPVPLGGAAFVRARTEASC